METSAILTIGLLGIWCSLCVDDKDKSDQRMLGYALGFGLLFILFCKNLYSEDECSRYEYLDDDDKRTDDQKKADNENISNTIMIVSLLLIIVVVGAMTQLSPGVVASPQPVVDSQQPVVASQQPVVDSQQPVVASPQSKEAQQPVVASQLPVSTDRP